MDWLLRHPGRPTRGRAGSGPARRSRPRSGSNRPWPQWVTLLVVLRRLDRARSSGSTGARGRPRSRTGSAWPALRICAGPARRLHALRGRALGRADGPAVLRRHGRRLGQPASRRPVRQTPRRRPPPKRTRQASGRAEARRGGRSARDCCLLGEGPKLLRELQKQNKVRLYLAVERAARLLHAIDAARGRGRRARQARQGRADRRSVEAGRVCPAGLDRTPGRPAVGLPAPDRRPDDRRRIPRQGRRACRPQKGVPIYPVGLGSPEPARDLELTELLVDDVVFVDDLVRFQAKLLARGFEGQEVTLRLRAHARYFPSRRSRTRDRHATGQGARRQPAAPGRDRATAPSRPARSSTPSKSTPSPRELQADNNRIERTS